MGKYKKVYMYDMNNNLIKIFETTLECAKYFGKPNSYINHSLYCNDKIRKDNKWYKISRNIELCKE